MNGRREVLLRRTWPQRLVVVASIAVIVAAIGAVRLVETVREVWEDVYRVPILGTDRFGQPLLQTDTPSGEPVNFLLVGTDSALGLDPGDPVLHKREVDPTGRSLADTIMLVRLDPVSGSAWVLSIPRDLWAEIPRAQDNRIASALFIGGPELLVATVRSMFDVEINHYVEMDLAGFREVVDSLGGVAVWFPNPVRDPGSGLNIVEPGCHLLDGERALQYVRSRRYTEQIDGRWHITGGDDFSRIQRQQDFLVLTLDRAISRGARNPTTIVDMLEAGAASVTLDQDLTLGEMVDLARAFADFNPENLNRNRLDLYTLWWPDGSYQGEAAYRDSNKPVLDVFRGLTDSVRPADVTLTITGADESDRADALTVLGGEGFDVTGTGAVAEIPETVVVHGPGDRAAAMALARFLDPVPYVVADDSVDGVVLALGADHRGVLFLFQEPLDLVEEQVAARGAPQVLPDLDAASQPAPSGSGSGSAAGSGSGSAAGSGSGSGSGSAAGSGSGSAATSDQAPASPTTTGAPAVAVAAAPADDGVAPPAIVGRAPEGVSCG